MKLYRKADGTWAGTQADAGKGAASVEVPTDKPSLLAWLNENAVFKPTEGQEGGEGSTDSREPEKRADGAENGHKRCPKCHWDYRRAAAAAEKLVIGANNDALCLMVENLKGWELGNVALSVASRMKQLADQAKEEPRNADSEASPRNDAADAGGIGHAAGHNGEDSAEVGDGREPNPEECLALAGQAEE